MRWAFAGSEEDDLSCAAGAVLVLTGNVEGDWVEAGDILLEIDPREQRLLVEEARVVSELVGIHGRQHFLEELGQRAIVVRFQASLGPARLSLRLRLRFRLRLRLRPRLCLRLRPRLSFHLHSRRSNWCRAAHSHIIVC